MTTLQAARVDEGTFQGASGELHRRSVLPAARPWAHLGVLHGYGEHCGRHGAFMEWLAERGVACHALDFCGHGRSPGRRGFVQRWEQYLEDVSAFLALDHLSSRSRGDAPLFMLGHSHGGLVLACAGIRGLPGVSGCILSSPYLRLRMPVPAYKILLARMADPFVPWLALPSGVKSEWMSSDEAMVHESRGDPLVFRTATPRWYLGALRAQAEALERAGDFRLPLLVLGGGADPVADPGIIQQFHDRAGSADKALRIYPDHLHEILRESGREAIFAEIQQWLEHRTAAPAPSGARR